MRSLLATMKVLQDSQVKEAQTKLMQAGIRSKEWAVAVIFGRLVLPIVFGGLAVFLVYGTDMVADYSPLKRYGMVAITFILAYKAPDIFLKNKITKRSDAIRKGLPDALDLLVICAEAGLTVDSAFHRVARELGRAYPELGDEFTLTAIELGFLTERRQAFENLAMASRSGCGEGRCHDDDPDREIRHPPRLRVARAVGGIPQRTDDARRGKGRAPARDHDRAVDPVHPADVVHRHPGSRPPARSATRSEATFGEEDR